MRFFARVAALGLALGAMLPRAAASLPRAQVASGPDLARPWAVAVESAGTLLAIDPGRNAVLRVDPVGGARVVVSDLKTGGGPAFVQPFDVAVIAGGDAVVRDAKSLLRVDAVTGDRALLSGTGRGSGPPFVDPRRIVTDGDSVLVADSVQPAIFRVDVATGDRTVVSGCSAIQFPLMCIGAIIGTGTPLTSPVAVAIESGGDLLAAQFGQLLRIDRLSGNRTLVSDETRGTGAPLGSAEGLMIGPSGAVFWSDRSSEAVIRIDPATGDRAIVSGASTGSGPAFQALDGLAIEAAGTIVVCDSQQGSLLRVQIDTGARSLISGGPIGSGVAFQCPSGFVEDDGSVLVSDGCLRDIVRLDTSSGNRTMVSGSGHGSGPRFRGLRALAGESPGSLLALQSGSVLRVDPHTGDRTLLTSSSHGSGPRFTGPRSIAVEPAGSALVGCHLVFCAAIFCAPEFAWELVRVDAVTGDRSLLSGGGIRGHKRGSGPSVESSAFLVVDAAGGVLAVSAEGQIVRVDPSSGDRTLVWDGSPPLSFPGGVAMEATGSLVITSNGAVVRFNPSTGATTILTDATHGAGPFLQSPGVIAVEPQGTLIVADHSVLTGAESVLRVDPVSGDRTYVAR